MAQLIKLKDYVSRYDLDPYRYPSQFIRLKNQHWKRLYSDWENDSLSIYRQQNLVSLETTKDSQERSFVKKIKSGWKKNNSASSNIDIPALFQQTENQEELNLVITTIPKSEEELKMIFMEHIFRIQLKWASSTISEISTIDKDWTRNNLLQHLLMRFPDHNLILFQPVFLVKQAELELDIIIVTPSEALCVTFLEGRKDAVFIVRSESLI
ncbi:hypothetical protein [Metabacillus arenae]|uniref:Uncharacterized protein n=1 Tax=Metabacillus arenae TaxID=2771434 RepID=A0A926NFJ5_9BACI|nr:hypothetical protein [Metabacillus arenae]MBD1380185.1 hypothetical protein [Metabacillus arenae]